MLEMLLLWEGLKKWKRNVADMIEITKEEAMQIRKNNPDVLLSRTMKTKSKRGKFFIEETQAAIEALHKIRKI